MTAVYSQKLDRGNKLVSSEGTEYKGTILGIYLQSMLWQANSDHWSEEAGLAHSTNHSKLQYLW